MQMGIDAMTAKGLGLAATLVAIPAVLKLRSILRRYNGEGATWIDSRTSLYNLSGLGVQGGTLLATCHRQGRGLSMAVFDCSDLIEVRRLYERPVSRMLVQHIVKKLTALAGKNGIVACTGPGQFSLLMAQDADAARSSAREVLGHPATFEIEADGGEVVLTPSFLIEQVPQGASIEKFHAVLSDKLARISAAEQKRLRSMQRERERHSRPAPLQAAPRKPEFAATRPQPRLEPFAAFQQIPPTIPMPLSRR
jgi:GGDEF domain-containing protein